jgi:hypothetical protein
MAYGSALVDVVQSSTAGAAPQFNDGNGTQTGTLCRAWVNFGYVSSAMTTRASFNVSSVTRNGTGDYTVNFTTALSDANYSAMVSGNTMSGASNVVAASIYPYNSTTISQTTTTLRVYAVATGGGGGNADLPLFNVAVFR